MVKFCAGQPVKQADIRDCPIHTGQKQEHYDSRNSSYKPSSGYKTSFYQKLPMVSSNNEITNTFIFTKHKKLNKETDMVGKASIYFSTVNSIDDSDVRISKRLNVPSYRLRGFERGKVGPKDGSDFIGGNYATSFNFSSTLPSFFENSENIDFLFFIDAANVWGVDYSSSINDGSKLRSSFGLGIDWLTPIGPLNFTFAETITKADSDITENFRFNLGTTF